MPNAFVVNSFPSHPKNDLATEDNHPPLIVVEGSNHSLRFDALHRCAPIRRRSDPFR